MKGNGMIDWEEVGEEGRLKEMGKVKEGEGKERAEKGEIERE